jgi:hypothetical protein
VNSEKQIVDFILTSVVAGVLGVTAMETVMWLITRAGWAKANMIVAIGSLFTRSRQNAFGLGVVLHGISGFGFAAIYVYAIMKLGLSHFPTSVFVGVGLGILHGLVVSLALVWMVAERHPLEEFREAGMAVGVSHFAGHLAFGAAVGLVIAMSPL